MVKASELTEWANDIYPVIVDINLTMKNLQIIKVERKKENNFLKHESFKFIRSQQRFILTIQLAKIFSDSSNQKRNFLTLCNRLENEKLDQEINRLLQENIGKLTSVFRDKQDIKNAITKFKANLKRHKTLVENIITMRNKVYAHTDIIKPKGIKIKHEEFAELVTLANEMYNTLFGSIFDIYIFFEHTVDFDLRYIIKTMTKNKNIILNFKQTNLK